MCSSDLLAGSGAFVMTGHTLIFSAFRTGSMGAVVPFLYTSTVWALISGVVVFGSFPNFLASIGIAIIVATGVVVILAERRRQRLARALAPKPMEAAS